MTVKNRITVNLQAEEYQELRRIAAGADRSLAWLGRRAIRDFLRRIRNSDQATSMLTSAMTSDEKRASQ